MEVIRATEDEKQYQIQMLDQLHAANHDLVEKQIQQVQQAAIQNQNIFAHLMETTKVASLGEITKALFEVGGQYRRNM
jgi:methylmalonyl-CoA mutase